MDITSEENLNSVEEYFIRMVNNFVQSFSLLSKSDSQIQSCIDSLNSVVLNILEVYKLCFLTRSNAICCQNVIASLDCLKDFLKSFPLKGKKDINTPEKRGSNNQSKDFNLPVKKSEHSSDKCSFTFGDVNYEAIMNNLRKDKTCDFFSSKYFEDKKNEQIHFNSSTQTELSMSNSLFNPEKQNCTTVCSKGIQVDNVKPVTSLESLNGFNFESDFNLNDPYMCNQNFEHQYQNVHYYDDTSYQNSVERCYQEHLTNFSHQYQPVHCGSLPLPSRNITAPIFLPRLIASSSSLHNSDHNSSIPYAITMFSSNQSYIPGAFNAAVGSPHYFGLSNHCSKESKKSHRKSDISLPKRNKSCNSKFKDSVRNLKKEKHRLLGETSDCSQSSDRICYLSKIDHLERACNVDLASEKSCYSETDFTSSIGHNVYENESEFSENIENQCNFSPNIPETKSNNLGTVSDYSVLVLNENDISAQIKDNGSDNNSTDLLQQDVASCEISSLLNKCDAFQNDSLLESQSLSTSSSGEQIDVSVLHHNNNSDECDGLSRKHDVKLSFVNVLRTGLKSVDTKMCSMNKPSTTTYSHERKIDEPSEVTPPNVFELSHFPTLQSCVQPPLAKTGDILNFDPCKPQLPCVFSNVEKTIQENQNTLVSDHSSRPSVSNVDNKNSDYSETLKKNFKDVTKGLAIKKKLTYSNHKKNFECKNPKRAYHYMKYSSIVPNSKNIKDDYAANNPNVNRKIDNPFSSVNKKYKPDEVLLQKKNSFSKRKSIPGEDGWTVIPMKLRSSDLWSSNKKSNSLNMINTFDGIKNCESKNNKENEISLKMSEDAIYVPSQYNYFPPVPLDCPTFFKDSSNVSDKFKMSGNLSCSGTDNRFSLPSISRIDTVPEDPESEKNSLDDSFPQLSNYNIPSPTPLSVNLSPCGKITDDGCVQDHTNVNFTQLNSYSDKTSLSEDVTNQCNNSSVICDDPVLMFEQSEVNSEAYILDDVKFSKCPLHEGSEIANFLSHSLCWSELFKPYSDGDYQNLNEEDQRKSRELQEEALMLRKKIKDLQLNENEVDTENEYENDNAENIDPQEIFTEYSHYLSQISWGDQIDEMERFQEMLSSDPDDSIFKFQYGSIEQFRELVARHPGKALDLHDKLLAKSKRTNSDELYEARRKRAEEKRQRLLNRKAAKMRVLLQRVEEVRQAQLQIIEERKCRLRSKLRKAEENRNLHLKTIQKKAHDEEEKLKEIAFINELEAQNRRHEFLALRQEQEERIQNIMKERQRKVDEKAAKEAAVGERKRVLEAEKMEKLEKMQQKRREKEEHIGKKQQERELERLVTAREKAREREERLQAIQAAQIANVKELQKKIKKKQENMARRHEENIQHIRQKAVETATLRNTLPEDSNSDLSTKSSLPSEKKKKAKSMYGIEEPSCTKQQKKKCKKIRIRLRKHAVQFSSLNEFHKESGSRIDLNLKSIIEVINKLIDNHELTSEGGLVKLGNKLCKMNNNVLTKLPDSKESFRAVGGFELCQKILIYLLQPELLRLSANFRCVENIMSLLEAVCDNDFLSIEYFMSCSHLCDFLDGIAIVVSDVLCLEHGTNKNASLVSAFLITFLETFFKTCSPSKNSKQLSKGLVHQLKDLSSYFLHSGFLKKLGDVIKLASLETDICRVDNQLIESIVSFITRLIHPRYFGADLEELLLSTDFMGTVSWLYGHLHQAKQSSPSITLCIINFFKIIASEHLTLFQKVLGSDGFSLQFRYIAGFILQQCTDPVQPFFIELLNQTILVIGYFALKNHGNQMVLQSGQAPTVLQQLIDLPIAYFVVPKLKCILFPTLIAICDGNAMCRESLENEMSYTFIEEFLQDPISEQTELMQLLHKSNNE